MVKRPKASKTTFRPRPSPAAKPLLANIGVPRPGRFVPDPFQEAAVEAVAGVDVLVAAPTGSGKTWIAEKAMRRVRETDGRAWYASPLKALSNAKFVEFSHIFGGDQVGILTGDRKENAGAPIIVGTTEILRNQLYDAMETGEDLGYDLVVLDEAHYLGDQDRGTVWEEVIIYLPHRIRLLLLSATLSNAEELAQWLSHVRRQPCRVILTQERPVPLKPLFLVHDGEVWPLTSRTGLNPRIQHLLKKQQLSRMEIAIDRIMACLEELDLLPAIFFLTSRADCEKALAQCQNPETARWRNLKGDLTAAIDNFLGEFGFLRGNPMIGRINRFGAAAHHAGLLPHLKLLVERLMQAGLLRAIFSTSTVAAGVNFPARSVVIPQSDRFNGRDFQALSATELAQMTGRAGRRGMDRVGFVVLVPGPHQDLPLVASLLNSPPEPIESRIRLSFSMVLNLLLSHTPDTVKPVLSLSLAAFQSAGEAKREDPAFIKKLGRSLEFSSCRTVESAVLRRQSQAELEAELARLEQERPDLEGRLRLLSLLKPGRVVVDDRGRAWMVKKQANRKARPGVIVSKTGPGIKLRHGKIRLKFLGLDRISLISDTVVSQGTAKEMVAAVRRLSTDDLKPAREGETLSPEAQRALDDARTRIINLQDSVKNSPCPSCPLSMECLAHPPSDLGQNLNRAEAWLEHLAREERRLWMEFIRRLDFLRSEGFADTEDKLTDLGRTAAKLRLDHPLIIAEAIRKKALPENNPELLAGLMGPFVLDSDKTWPKSKKKLGEETELTAALFRMEQAVSPLISRQKSAGFDYPSLPFGPAVALYAWAGGGDWTQILNSFQIEAGDLASLVYRTADNLRQLSSLGETHPSLAACARKARDLLLREPVIVPT